MSCEVTLHDVMFRCAASRYLMLYIVFGDSSVTWPYVTSRNVTLSGLYALPWDLRRRIDARTGEGLRVGASVIKHSTASWRKSWQLLHQQFGQKGHCFYLRALSPQNTNRNCHMLGLSAIDVTQCFISWDGKRRSHSFSKQSRHKQIRARTIMRPTATQRHNKVTLNVSD